MLESHVTILCHNLVLGSDFPVLQNAVVDPLMAVVILKDDYTKQVHVK